MEMTSIIRSLAADRSTEGRHVEVARALLNYSMKGVDEGRVLLVDGLLAIWNDGTIAVMLFMVATSVVFVNIRQLL